MRTVFTGSDLDDYQEKGNDDVIDVTFHVPLVFRSRSFSDVFERLRCIAESCYPFALP